MPSSRIGRIAFEAIARAQRRCLVGAAKRVERFGRDAGGGLGPGMILAQKFFVRGESGLTKCERVAQIARDQQQPGRLPRTRFVWGCWGLGACTKTNL